MESRYAQIAGKTDLQKLAMAAVEDGDEVAVWATVDLMEENEHPLTTIAAECIRRNDREGLMEVLRRLL